jgi:hypothetical protein
VRTLVYRRAFPVVKAGDRSKMWLDIRDLDAWIEKEKKFL